MKDMASGNQLDAQRELRWPNKTLDQPTVNEAAPNPPQAGKGLKVKFRPWEEDNDFSDMEGIMGPSTEPAAESSDDEW